MFEEVNWSDAVIFFTFASVSPRSHVAKHFGFLLHFQQKSIKTTQTKTKICFNVEEVETFFLSEAFGADVFITFFKSSSVKPTRSTYTKAELLKTISSMKTMKTNGNIRGSCFLHVHLWSPN